jgi:hypothetical protein
VRRRGEGSVTAGGYVEANSLGRNDAGRECVPFDQSCRRTQSLYACFALMPYLRRLRLTVLAVAGRDLSERLVCSAKVEHKVTGVIARQKRRSGVDSGVAASMKQGLAPRVLGNRCCPEAGNAMCALYLEVQPSQRLVRKPLTPVGWANQKRDLGDRVVQRRFEATQHMVGFPVSHQEVEPAFAVC